MRELSSSTTVGIIGLGYVGLPLALACSRQYSVRGFDLSHKRIASLRTGQDHTGEVDPDDFKDSSNPLFTTHLDDLRECDVYIVTVPTPIDENNEPALALVRLASAAVGHVLKQGSMVIYESTMYPGATEEVCVPIIERHSGMTLNRDFWVGYSPERVNPGDKTHRLSNVIKITSGSDAQSADFVDRFYRSFVDAGTHRAPSIRVAEAAKVIENIQRDINIALMNEFSQLFGLLDLDTAEVLAAASTKWNFLPFKPGLVGGHCIGVDPYYLTYKAREVGFDPKVILAGRATNNSVPQYVAERVNQLLEGKGKSSTECNALVLGITYKENCPDTRNSKSIELVRELRSRGMTVDICDPVARTSSSSLPNDIRLNPEPKKESYDAVILSVAHDEFTEIEPEALLAAGSSDAVVFDVQHVLPRSYVSERL